MSRRPLRSLVMRVGLLLAGGAGLGAAGAAASAFWGSEPAFAAASCTFSGTTATIALDGTATTISNNGGDLDLNGTTTNACTGATTVALAGTTINFTGSTGPTNLTIDQKAGVDFPTTTTITGTLNGGTLTVNAAANDSLLFGSTGFQLLSGGNRNTLAAAQPYAVSATVAPVTVSGAGGGSFGSTTSSPVVLTAAAGTYTLNGNVTLTAANGSASYTVTGSGTSNQILAGTGSQSYDIKGSNGSVSLVGNGASTYTIQEEASGNQVTAGSSSETLNFGTSTQPMNFVGGSPSSSITYTLNGLQSGSTVTAGSGTETFTMPQSTTGVTFTGGSDSAGTDTFNFTSSGANSGNNANHFVGGAGTDSFNLTTGAPTTTNNNNTYSGEAGTDTVTINGSNNVFLAGSGTESFYDTGSANTVDFSNVGASSGAPLVVNESGLSQPAGTSTLLNNGQATLTNSKAIYTFHDSPSVTTSNDFTTFDGANSGFTDFLAGGNGGLTFAGRGNGNAASFFGSTGVVVNLSSGLQALSNFELGAASGDSVGTFQIGAGQVLVEPPTGSPVPTTCSGSPIASFCDALTDVNTVTGPQAGYSTFYAGDAPASFTFSDPGDHNTFIGGTGQANFSSAGNFNTYVAGFGQETFTEPTGLLSPSNQIDFSAVPTGSSAGCTTAPCSLLINVSGSNTTLNDYVAALFDANHNQIATYIFGGSSGGSNFTSFIGASSGDTTFEGGPVVGAAPSGYPTYKGQGTGNTLDFSEVSTPSALTLDVTSSPFPQATLGNVTDTFSGVTNLIGLQAGNTTFKGGSTGGYSFTGKGTGNSADFTAQGPSTSISVKVTSPVLSPVNVGTVSFFLPGNPVPICSAVPVANGSASCYAQNLASGPNQFEAVYTPPAGSTFTGSGFVISNGSNADSTTTTTTLPAPSGTIHQYQNVTLTATVTDSHGSALTTGAGTVTFSVAGGQILCSSVNLNPSGQASCTTSNLPAGTDDLLAVFTPASGTYSGSVNSTVPAVAVLDPVATAVTNINYVPFTFSAYTCGTEFIFEGDCLTAIVSGVPTGDSGTVTFYYDSTSAICTTPSITQPSTGTISLSCSPFWDNNQFPLNGSSITAVFTPSGGQPTGMAGSVTTVNSLITGNVFGNSVPTTSSSVSGVTILNSGSGLTAGTRYTLEATVSSTSSLPGGTLSFDLASGFSLAPLCNVTVPSGSTSATLQCSTPFPAGGDTIVVFYTPSNNTVAGSAASTSITVTDPSSSTTTQNGSTTQDLTSGVTINLGSANVTTITATLTPTSGTFTGGTVTFQVLGTTLCSAIPIVIQSGGKSATATCVTSVPLGGQTVTAVYTPSSGSAPGATSSVVSVVVSGGSVLVAAPPSTSSSWSCGATPLPTFCDSLTNVSVVTGSGGGHNIFVAGSTSETFADTGAVGQDAIDFTGVSAGNGSPLTVNVSGVGTSDYTATLGTAVYNFQQGGPGFTTVIGSLGGFTTFQAGSTGGYTFIGQGSNDSISFQAESAPITANLSNLSWTSPSSVTLGPNQVLIGSGTCPLSCDGISGISTIVGSSTGGNRFIAGPSNEVFQGGSGNIVDFSNLASAVVVNVSAFGQSPQSTNYGTATSGGNTYDFTNFVAAPTTFVGSPVGTTFYAGSQADTFIGQGLPGDTLNFSLASGTLLSVNVLGGTGCTSGLAILGTTSECFSGINTFDGLGGGGSTTTFVAGSQGGYTFNGVGGTNSIDFSSQGASVTLSGVLTATAAIPGGTVTFLNGTLVLCSVTLSATGVSTETVSCVTTGNTSSVSAVYTPPAGSSVTGTVAVQPLSPDTQAGIDANLSNSSATGTIHTGTSSTVSVSIGPDQVLVAAPTSAGANSCQLSPVACDNLSGISIVTGSTSGHNTFVAGTTSEKFRDLGSSHTDTLDFSNVPAGSSAPLTINVSGVGTSAYQATFGTVTYDFTTGSVDFSTIIGATGGFTTFLAGDTGGYAFKGQGGSNIADFSSASCSITANFGIGSVSLPCATGPDTITNITTVVGSSGGHNTFVAGSGGSEIFQGGTNNTVDFSGLSNPVVVNVSLLGQSPQSTNFGTATSGGAVYDFTSFASSPTTFIGSAAGTTFYAGPTADTFKGNGSSTTLNFTLAPGSNLLVCVVAWASSGCAAGGQAILGTTTESFSGITTFDGLSSNSSTTTFVTGSGGGLTFNGVGGTDSLDFSPQVGTNAGIMSGLLSASGPIPGGTVTFFYLGNAVCTASVAASAFTAEGVSCATTVPIPFGGPFTATYTPPSGSLVIGSVGSISSLPNGVVANLSSLNYAVGGIYVIGGTFSVGSGQALVGSGPAGGSCTLNPSVCDTFSNVSMITGSANGSNTFVAGATSQIFADNGTAGNDTIDFSNLRTTTAANPLTINASKTAANGLSPYTATFGAVTYTFTSNGSDFVNFVGAFSGNTKFQASGSSYGLSFTGKGGNDTADFSQSTSTVTVNMATDVVTFGGNPLNVDTISGTISTVVGSQFFANTFYGDLSGTQFTSTSTTNTVSYANITLPSGAGVQIDLTTDQVSLNCRSATATCPPALNPFTSDTFSFPSGGTLTIQGSTGNDYIYIGGNQPVQLMGGATSTTLDLSRVAKPASGTAGVTVNLKFGFITGSTIGQVSFTPGCTGTNLCVTTIIGSPYDDTFTLNPSGPAVSINGNGGNDTLDLSQISTASTITMPCSISCVATKGGSVSGGTSATFTSIENIIGTQAGTDTIIVGSGTQSFTEPNPGPSNTSGTVDFSNLLTGITLTAFDSSGTPAGTVKSPTNVVTVSFTGFSTFNGSQGSDTFTQTTAGNFVFNGGPTGNNILDLSSAPAGIVVSFNPTAATCSASSNNDGTAVLGGQVNDSFTCISEVISSGSLVFKVSPNQSATLNGGGSGTLVLINPTTGATITLGSTGTVTGGGYNFSFTGMSTIDGTGMGDLINAGTGSYTINEPGGSNTISFLNAPSAVTVNDSNSTYAGVPAFTTSGGYGGTIVINGISNIIGTSRFNDILVAGSGPGTLVGGTGNDRFVLTGGNDIISGGSGASTLDLSQIPGQTSLNLGTSAPQSLGSGAGYLTLMSGNIQTVVASPGGSQIWGGNGNLTIVGGAGNDWLAAGTGTQTLIGGGGNDTLVAGIGTDTLQGGSAPVTFVPGQGTDTLTSTGSGNTLSYSGVNNPVNVNLSANLFSVPAGEPFAGTVLQAYTASGGNGATVNLSQANISTVIGSNGSDIFVTGPGGDTIFGHGHNDLFVVDSGNNTLTAAPGSLSTFLFEAGGSNVINGGGSSTVDFSQAPSPVTVNLQTGTATGGFANSFENLAGILNITGSKANGNVLIAGGPHATLIGLGANDLLVAYGQDTLINAGPGGDTFCAQSSCSSGAATGSGNTMVGGPGNDVFFTRNGGFDSINGGGGFNQAQTDPEDSAVNIQQFIS